MYTRQLSQSSEAMEYLVRRGLTEATIDYFRLGYVAEPADGYARYRGAITIPYLNPNRSVRVMRFRFLDPNRKPKYESFKGGSKHLFNVAATAQDKVWVCEGEFDAMILSQMGYPAVAVGGTNGFTTDWKYLFVNAEEVSLVFDNDTARKKSDGTEFYPGQEAANRIASILGPVVENLRVLRLPTGMDVTDLYLSDRGSLQELIQ